MLAIKVLSDQIIDEATGARDYAKLAAELKVEDQQLSSLYLDLSNTEMGHMDRLHQQAVKMIERLRAEGREAPDYMLRIWEDRHRKAVEIAAEAKSYQALLR